MSLPVKRNTLGDVTHVRRINPLDVFVDFILTFLYLDFDFAVNQTLFPMLSLSQGILNSVPS